MKKKIGIIFLLIALFILVFILYNIFVNNSNNKNESEIVKQEKLNSGKRLSVDIVDYNIPRLL